MRDLIQNAFTEAGRTLRSFIQDEDNFARLQAAITALAECFRQGGKAIACGNGGSMCDAMHFAEELAGKFRSDRPALPAIALSDPSYLTCVANDYGFDHAFARGIEAFARPGDCVLGISTSGNSANVIRALQAAHDRSCVTIALLGGDGGSLKGVCDHQLIVPHSATERIQELHGLIIHVLIEGVEETLFPQPISGNQPHA